MGIGSMGIYFMDGNAWIIGRKKQGFKSLHSNEKISHLPNDEPHPPLDYQMNTPNLFSRGLFTIL